MASLRTYLSLAGFLPSVTLVLAFYVLLRASRGSMWRIALLALPGTIAHELSHFVVGALLLAKPHGFSIRPKASGNTWTLGAVSFGNVGLLNGAFVALELRNVCRRHALDHLAVPCPRLAAAVEQRSMGMVDRWRIFDGDRALRRAAIVPGPKARRPIASAVWRACCLFVVGLYPGLTPSRLSGRHRVRPIRRVEGCQTGGYFAGMRSQP